MFIPRYWSEASQREILPPRRQITVRRFGWSSTSQADADVNARARVEEALGVLRSLGPKGLRDFTRREFMSFVGVDPLYECMCRLQKCFRARVSPKPWRAHMPEHFRAGGTWPVTDPAKLAARAAWVRKYEDLTRGYAACRFAEVVGDGAADPQIAAIQALHDEMCQAETSLRLA